MKELEAEEFLSANKDEDGIWCAAEAGGVIFGILLDEKEISAEKPDPRNHHSLDEPPSHPTDAHRRWRQSKIPEFPSKLTQVSRQKNATPTSGRRWR
jgi:hypothetical protein